MATRVLLHLLPAHFGGFEQGFEQGFLNKIEAAGTVGRTDLTVLRVKYFSLELIQTLAGRLAPGIVEVFFRASAAGLPNNG